MGELFDREQNLAGVIAEMFDDVVDGGDSSSAVALNSIIGGELSGVSGLDDGGDLVDAGAEKGEEIGGVLGVVGVVSTASGEFGVTLAGVGLTVQAGEDPLADIAAQVEDEIGDGIFLLAMAEPELIVGDESEGVADLLGVLP